MQILQLEKRLKDQLKERRALEKALGLKSSSFHGDTSPTSMPRVTISSSFWMSHKIVDIK